MATRPRWSPELLARHLDRLLKVWRYFLALIAQPRRTPWLLWQILVRRVHAGELLRLMPFAPWLQQRGIETVLDAGAHGGEFASAIHALVPTARIFAFEPQSAQCQAIPRRLGRGARLKTFNVALGNRDGTATFYRSDFSKASSLLPMAERHRQAFPWTAKQQTTEVAVRALDSLIEDLEIQPAVLLKIDVQGSELPLLEGAIKTLEGVELVLVETSMVPLYEGDAPFAAVYRWLAERGFRYAGSYDQLLDSERGEVLQQDSLFVREGGDGVDGD